MRFKKFVEICTRISSTSSIMEKTDILASILKNMDKSEWEPLLMLISGNPVGEEVEGGLGIGYSSILRALRNLGKPLLPPPPPTVEDVYKALNNISKIRGEGSQSRRLNILIGLLSSMSELEREWLLKIVFGELRIGMDEGNILKAIAKVLNTSYEKVRRGYLLSGSLRNFIRKISTSGGLDDIGIDIYIPLRPMLATPAESIEEAFTMIGGGSIAVEVKYDGARVQIHIGSRGVKIYSRRLTDVTRSLPDVIDIINNGVLKRVDEAIVEGEVIAVRDGKPLPFQVLMRRFRRVKDINEVMGEIPVELHLFDILYINGRLLIDQPYRDRFRILEEYFDRDIIVDRIITSSIEDAKAFYNNSISMGHEGVMLKNPESPYIMGVRGKYWVKVKEAEYADLVIVGAEWGHGRRRGWLSDYYLAAYDPANDDYIIVGKTFKGLTDPEFQYMTDKLQSIKISDEGYRIWVRPEIVVEVAFNEIQESPKYKGGIALRLARIKRIREDKSPREATTIYELLKLYKEQFRYKALY